MTIEQELTALKERNQRVEADKAWETSWFRIIILTVAIYVIAALVMFVAQIENYLLSASIPALGYFLSTRSLPLIRKWWIAKYFKA